MISWKYRFVLLKTAPIILFTGFRVGTPDKKKQLKLRRDFLIFFDLRIQKIIYSWLVCISLLMLRFVKYRFINCINHVISILRINKNRFSSALSWLWSFSSYVRLDMITYFRVAFVYQSSLAVEYLLHLESRF